MTRLVEALERARTIADEPANQAAEPSLVPADPPPPAMPQTWQVENREIEVPAALVGARFDAKDQAPAKDSTHEEHERADQVGNESEEEPEDEEVAAFDYQLVANRTAGKLVVGPEMDHTLVEQYRRLVATLHHAQMRTGNNMVMVSSAVEAEGKTLTATNVALTLSHSYRRRVLLVDADLRRPTIHELFGLDNRTGLRDVLKQTSRGKLPIQQISPTLWVLTAGRPDPDPMSGLISDNMRQFLIEAAEQFDWVVIDTPPVALMPDANLLAAMVDAALLVVSASSTPYPLVARAVEAIGASRVLGVVLNRAERSEVNVGYSYYNYYSSRRSNKSKPRRRFRFALHRKG